MLLALCAWAKYAPVAAERSTALKIILKAIAGRAYEREAVASGMGVAMTGAGSSNSRGVGT